MDIKPTKERKKKKVSKKREHEINRRRASLFKESDAQNTEGLLVPTLSPLVTYSAPSSRRGSVSELSDKELIKESEEDQLESVNKVVRNAFQPHKTGEDIGGMEDLWKHTLPIAVMENTWKNKTRRASMRRRSSGVSEEDAKAALDRLRMEKTVNVMKRKMKTILNSFGMKLNKVMNRKYHLI